MKRIMIVGGEGIKSDAVAALLQKKLGHKVIGQASMKELRDALRVAHGEDADALCVLSPLEQPHLGFLAGACAYSSLAIIALLPAEDVAKIKEATGLEAPRLFGIDPQGPTEELKEALGAIGTDRRPESGRGTRQRYGGSLDLTRREYDVVLLVAKGLTNRNIAEAAGLQEQSVKNLVSVIMRKLRCENRVQVALKVTGQEITTPLRVVEGA